MPRFILAVMTLPIVSQPKWDEGQFLAAGDGIPLPWLPTIARGNCLKRKTLFASCILLLSTLALGQAIPQFSSVEPHQYDSINLGTLGIQLNVPIRSKAGHIPYSYRLVGASQVTVVNGQSSWLQASPLLTGGEAHVMRGASVGKTTNCYDSNHGLQGVSYSSFYVTDANGSTHRFLFTIGTPFNACNSPTKAGGYALDNSGLYLYADDSGGGSIIYTLHDISGDTFPSGSITDPNGNTITPTIDSLGQTAITVNGSSYSWTDALGNNQAITLTKTPYTLYTAFGCSIDGTPGANYPFPTSISFPDGSSLGLSWEANALNNVDKTGRIASITLPTGGTISYAYSGGTNGINCIDGTPATMTRTTPDGTWTYTHVPPSAFVCGTTPTATTTVQDPQGNNTVYTFNVGACPVIGPAPVRGITLEAERQVYNGSVAPANLIETVITCYNNTSSSPTNCPAYAGNGVSEKDVYTTYPGVTGYSAVKTAYDSFGRVADVKTFDFNAASPTNEKIINYGTGNPTSQTCTAISTYIIDKPCSVTLKDSATGNILSQTWNSYDGNGNLTQTWNLVSGSGASGVYLSKSYTYSTTAPFGVVQTSTDVNGQVMNYTTTSCNNMFVTSQYPTNFSNLQTSQTWDCNGGVVTSATDANGQTTQTKFFVNSNADPFYRPLEDIDQLGYITSLSYPTPNSTESVFTFNSGQSVIDDLSTTDSIGRPVTSQLLQGPGSSSWDTKSRSFDSDGHVLQTSLPCVSTRGTGCAASTESQTYDGLNRPRIHTGTGGDIVTKTYPANDVLTILTPAPTGENLKSTQKEYDGLGRLKSVCVISNASGKASCGQTTAATGFLTTYSYDAAGRLLQTVENAQATSGPNQTRTYAYDKLGRILTEVNPEGNGTKSYTYDSASGTNCTSTPQQQGNLIQETDPNGNSICHYYDTLHRETSTTYAGPNSTVTKYFVYDSATVNGVAMGYAEGHMSEAYTCSGSCTTKITDDGFSYDKRGQMADYYQSSPNSGGYYHISATRWEDGGMQTVSGVGLPTITYGDADADAGLDGEGRVTQVSASSGTNPVSAVTYNTANNSEPVGALLTTTLGLGDTQNFTYDKNTGRMTQHSASVGATPTVISGSLTWNANGTLAGNNIVDGYNPADTQNCTYLYDDFIRAASVNCLNGSTNVWNQTFTYGTDAFGNLTKSTSGPGLSWACTACYNTANNHYNSTLSPNITYDNNGNLTDDTFHSYTWLADGHEATIGPSAHGIDPTTTSTVYDAMGNKVEETVNGTTHEYVSAFGVDAQMSGQTENSTLVGLPGGVQALYSGGTLQRFRFPDWEGTIRAESNPASRAFTESLAFAPFGERYATKGAAFNVDSFTGKPDQLVSDEYDFAAREEHNGQGRWVSPDPMPGTGNKYVYANNNPLSNVDVYGLFATVINGLETSSSDSEAPDYATQTESFSATSKQAVAQINFICANIDCSTPGTSPMLQGMGLLAAPPQTQMPQGQQQAQAARSQQQGQQAAQAQNQANGTATVIVTKDSTLGVEYGSHTALFLSDTPDGPALYDPAGSYKNETRGSGGIVTQEEGASLSDYVKYQESTGSKVETYTFQVSGTDQAKIYQRAEAIGDPRGLSCAASVTEAIKGVGPFSSVQTTRLPGRVADQMQTIQTAIAFEKAREWVVRTMF